MTSETTDPPGNARAPRPQGLVPLEEAFAELGRLVVGTRPLGEVMTRVAELVQACVPGADEVSVTLMEGKARTVAFTGRLAVDLDERQYEEGFGPCIDAADSGQVLRIDDTAHDETYPEFAAVAARRGVRSTLSVGLPMPQGVLGGINVYRTSHPPLDAAALELLRDFAGYAAVALANHSLYAAAVSRSEHLQTAMQSRAVIEQAKGVIMARLGCTADEAFQHLATQSQNANRKLRDLAEEVVARV
ncbi:GAF domain-containing protein [Kineococcus radiotolerans]|uniref:GAF domain-containing protein n=1 Tax=Kineococcus radiotolerans TaxID=131568 RepID=A0A7W4XXM9_KINRA|nr:ANTAR domain-containing protein [Kineococcus radiotolerans]MBB2901414.1 GAF domain-containing protein [Kineococcus radiotolerans]